jgi:hypothetical protein
VGALVTGARQIWKWWVVRLEPILSVNGTLYQLSFTRDGGGLPRLTLSRKRPACGG